MNQDKASFFTGEGTFYQDRQELDSVVAEVRKAVTLNPASWHQLEREVIPYLLSQPGVMPSIVANNPAIVQLLQDFFLGKRRLLVVGGAPGNGKSLFASEVRRCHAILSKLVPCLATRLAFIPFDQIRKTFYEQISLETGLRISPPRTRTAHTDVNGFISQVVFDEARYVLDRLPDARVLMEIPLYGNRREQLIHQLDTSASVIIMRSAEMEREIIEKGERDVDTSGSIAAMKAIRSDIIREMVASQPLSKDQEDEAVTNYWKTWAKGRALVVELVPNADRQGFDITKEVFKSNHIRSDELIPVPLRAHVAEEYKIRFRLMSRAEFDSLAKKAAE